MIEENKARKTQEYISALFTSAFYNDYSETQLSRSMVCRGRFLVG